jgi:hypothetical protein
VPVELFSKGLDRNAHTPLAERKVHAQCCIGAEDV